MFQWQLSHAVECSLQCKCHENRAHAADFTPGEPRSCGFAWRLMEGCVPPCSRCKLPGSASGLFNTVCFLHRWIPFHCPCPVPQEPWENGYLGLIFRNPLSKKGSPAMTNLTFCKLVKDLLPLLLPSSESCGSPPQGPLGKLGNLRGISWRGIISQ